MFAVPGHIHICLVKSLDQWRFSREEKWIPDLKDLNASVFIFQMSLTYTTYPVMPLKSQAHGLFDGAGNDTDLSLNDTDLQKVMSSVLICKLDPIAAPSHAVPK